MSHARVGIALERKAIVLVGVDDKHGKAELSFKLSRPIEFSRSLAENLEKVLGSVPPEWQRSEVRIALSPAFLACAELFEAPYASEGQLELAKGSLAESRCAGETIEELAVDCLRRRGLPNDSLVEVLALKHELLDGIRSAVARAWPQARVSLVTSIPSALSATTPTPGRGFALVLESAGEVFALIPNEKMIARWHCAPMDVSGQAAIEYGKSFVAVTTPADAAAIFTDDQLVKIHGCEIEGRCAPAVAAALVDKDACANLLRGAQDGPVSLRARVGLPILRLLACAAVFLCVLGLYFEHQTASMKAQIEERAQIERKMWQACGLRGDYRSGHLASELQRTVVEYTKSQAGNVPSALSFWAEIGAAMPAVESIGLELESLQLGADGGRLAARVSPGVPDPLANAALLERSLNRSQVLAARGEYENKTTDVLVRMRLDYQPKPQAEGRKQ